MRSDPTFVLNNSSAVVSDLLTNKLIQIDERSPVTGRSRLTLFRGLVVSCTENEALRMLRSGQSVLIGRAVLRKIIQRLRETD